jgi:hypothetical protein
MASLLERMNVDPAPGVGPVRSKPRRAGSAPYTRPPKGDINSPWKHDLYQQGAESAKSLSDRLDIPSKDTPPKMNFGSAAKALREATGQGVDKELSIRGASTRGNVVEVTGLVKGTTAEDVEVGKCSVGRLSTSCVFGPIPPRGKSVVTPGPYPFALIILGAVALRVTCEPHLPFTLWSLILWY